MEDAPALAREADDPAVYAGLRDYFPHPYTVDDALRFIEVVHGKGPRAPHWAVQVDGEVAGIMGVFPGEGVYRYNAELGYWLGRRFWGRGVGTEAIRLAVAHAWSELPLRRLYAEVFADNAGSIRALEKNGFTVEYRLDDVIVKNRRRLGVVCLGLRRGREDRRDGDR